MGRYTLTMETYDKQTINVCFQKADKMTSKVSLKTIDILTTQAKDQKDLLERLIKVENVKNISITYVANNKIWTVPIALSDKKDLTNLKMNGESIIDTNNNVFNNNMNKFLIMLEDRNFFNFAMNSNLLTSKQKEYIEEKMINSKNTSFFINKIRTYSSSYRQFRNILFLIEQFQVVNQNRTNYDKDVETVETYDPDEDQLYSEEEKSKYQEYMDNLPDDIPDYIYGQQNNTR